MKNVQIRSLEQILGLTGVPASLVVADRPGVKVCRYEGMYEGFCRIELADELKLDGILCHAPGKGVLVNGITNNISRLVRQEVPIMQLGLLDRSSLLAHYVQPRGLVKVGRYQDCFLVGNSEPERARIASLYFRMLAEAFEGIGLRLENLTVRFGSTMEGDLVVMNLFNHLDWSLWRGSERLASRGKNVQQIIEDYTTLDTLTSYMAHF